MKTYRVSVTAFATVLVVSAKSESEALESACDNISFGDMQMDEASIKAELTDADDIESWKRHSDVVVDLY